MQYHRYTMGRLTHFVLILLTLLPCWGYADEVIRGSFVKKSKSISGSFVIRDVAGRLILELGDDFKTKKGPDLKLVFSKRDLDQVTAKNATERTSLVLSLLKSTTGRQTYTLPDGFQLQDYKCLLIHCEKYAVLWGGGTLSAVPRPKSD